MPQLLCVDAVGCCCRGMLRLLQVAAGVGCGGRRSVPLEAAAVEGGCCGKLWRWVDGGIPEEKRGKKEKGKVKVGRGKGEGPGDRCKGSNSCRVKTLGNISVNVRIGMKKYKYGL